MSFDIIRRDTADNIYHDYDFGYEVESANGWEYVTPGTEMTKVVYLVNPDDADADSIQGTFTVRFESEISNVPVEAYANVRGEIVGNIMGGTLAERMIEAEAGRAPAM